MKTFFLTVGLAFLAMSFVIQENSLDQIVNAFKKADTEEIGQSFDDYVDIKFLDKDEIKNISRNQASIALRTFFSDLKITGFEKVSTRDLGTTTYLAGKLLTSDKNSKGYNITVLIKQQSGKFRIISLRIS
ncbi:hypothetical protein KACHI17_24030 [Sediminibacterium sp. KACHI17]|jgi:hypothetical protein|uniref:DUF4783 domain-containing protein n=1 Tax=Sediminibacterium sp. KACHI17 TaxID=1751071 RepID=A0AAT9GLF8_9BACT